MLQVPKYFMLLSGLAKTITICANMMSIMWRYTLFAIKHSNSKTFENTNALNVNETVEKSMTYDKLQTKLL